MIQKDTIEGYNQIKGKELFGLFEDNEIYEVDVVKNTESLFYVRDDKGDLIGINKSLSAKIKIILEEQEIVDVYYYNEVDSKTHPSSQFPDNEKEFKNFNWRGEERLVTKADLFKGRDSITLPKIKGIEDPEIYDDFFDGVRELNTNSTLEEESLRSTEEEDKEEPKSPKPTPKLKAIEPNDEQ